MKAWYCECKNTYTTKNCKCKDSYSAILHGIGSLTGQGSSVYNRLDELREHTDNSSYNEFSGESGSNISLINTVSSDSNSSNEITLNNQSTSNTIRVNTIRGGDTTESLLISSLKERSINFENEELTLELLLKLKNC